MPHAPVKETEQIAAEHAATAPTRGACDENGKKRTQPSKARSESRKGFNALRDFFAANPDEELTIEDAAAKLGVNTTSAGSYLAKLKGMGMLERVSIYRLKESP